MKCTKHIKNFILLLAIIIGLEALFVMAGWALGIDSLTRFFDVGANMAFPAAVMFLLSSAGLYVLYLAIVENNDTFAPAILVGITLMLFMINGTLLIGGLLKTQTGLEGIFLSNFNATEKGNLAVLPAAATVVAFFLYGMSNVFSLFPGIRRKKIAELFGWTIFLLGLLAIIGYILKVPVMYYKFNDTMNSMALNTAVEFVLLGGGLVGIGRYIRTNET